MLRTKKRTIDRYYCVVLSILAVSSANLSSLLLVGVDILGPILGPDLRISLVQSFVRLLAIRGRPGEKDRWRVERRPAYRRTDMSCRPAKSFVGGITRRLDVSVVA
ncbi:hypothetical protein B0T18DRAFT_83960 [Schizothecium vesticola]|uniref:Uncharacterized protein n=1 Tax=Schizothecium vesticola TaxID=314040 RepID=A0AA40F6C5_9PEZI|nr:hypothetical protein B0T18DRAFT_83960 [Schizothecium vesticola]